MSAQPADDLFARLASALGQIPREVELDAVLEKAVIAPEHPGGRSTIALVLSSVQSVMCYSVWPEPVPASRREEVRDYITRANTDLSTAVFEFDVDTGILATRAGIHFADIELAAELPASAFVRLVWLVILDVEELAARHDGGLSAVVAGSPVPEALAAITG